MGLLSTKILVTKDIFPPVILVYDVTGKNFVILQGKILYVIIISKTNIIIILYFLKLKKKKDTLFLTTFQ